MTLPLSVALHGEQSLAKEMLKIIPLIKKHFFDFHLQRITLASGENSKKFNNVKKAFRNDSGKLTKAKIRFDAKKYNAHLFVEINEQMPDRKTGCNYFSYIIRFGRIHEDYFAYDFDDLELIRRCQKILSTTEKELNAKKEIALTLKHELDNVLNSVPFEFKDIIKPY